MLGSLTVAATAPGPPKIAAILLSQSDWLNFCPGAGATGFWGSVGTTGKNTGVSRIMGRHPRGSVVVAEVDANQTLPKLSAPNLDA